MTIAFPYPVPAEPGMLAVRVTTPGLPIETMMAQSLKPGDAVYRIVLWREGRAYLGIYSGDPHDPPCLAAALHEQSVYPLGWQELLRS